MAITCRKIGEDEFPRVVQFLQAVAPRHGFSDEWFRWKYVNNPAGPPHIYFAEDAESKSLAGIYCIIAWNLVSQGKVFTCAQSVDTMIHPQYRGQGIVEGLSRFMFEDLKSTQVTALFGFPNEKFFPITLKIGWDHLGTMLTYVKPLTAEMLMGNWILPWPIPQLVNRFLKVIDNALYLFYNRGYELHEVYDFAGFDETELLGHGAMGTKRSARYLTWRYTEKPGVYYRIHCLKKEGREHCWIISKDADNESVILEILPVLKKDVFPALLLFSETIKREGRYGIRISCYGPICRQIKKAGFIYREKGLPIMFYDIDSGSSISIRSSNWSLMLGDLDAA